MMDAAAKAGFKRVGVGKVMNSGTAARTTISHSKAKILIKNRILTKSNILLTIMAFLLGRAAPGFGVTAFAFPFPNSEAII